VSLDFILHLKNDDALKTLIRPEKDYKQLSVSELGEKIDITCDVNIVDTHGNARHLVMNVLSVNIKQTSSNDSSRAMQEMAPE
jgi:hypothetical protein